MSTPTGDVNQHTTASAALGATTADAPLELDPHSPEALYKAGELSLLGYTRLVNARLHPKPEPRKRIPGPFEVVYPKSAPPSITPETVLQLLQEPALPLPGHGDSFIVHRITESLCVKYGEEVSLVEVTMMDFIRARTNIPIPTVHLVFTRADDITKPSIISTYIVMDCIPGSTLQKLWDSLDEPNRTSVLAQLQGYIRELRSIPTDTVTPGPLGGGICRGRWFSESGVGPFPTHEALVEWWNRCFPRPNEWSYEGEIEGRFQADQPLVFTHGDLNPRNLIVNDGVVWVIDWEQAGWYPWYVDPTLIATDIGHPDCRTPSDWADSVLPFFPDCTRELQMFDAIFPNINQWWRLERLAMRHHDATTSAGKENPKAPPIVARTLAFTYKMYRVTTEQFATAQLPLGQVDGHTITVRMTIDMVVHKRMHLYRYSRNDNGCRFWMRTFIEQLQRENILQAPTALQAADGVIQFYWSRNASPAAAPIDPDTFENPNF